MRQIQLTQEKIALIDDEDFEKVCGFRWHYVPETRRKSTLINGYAAANVYVRGSGHKGKTKTVLMHRLIADAQPGELVDHRDGDGLNNQKVNLRKCTQAENKKNRSVSEKPMSSKYKGVSQIKTGRKKWQASISVNRKQTYLGSFDSEEEAASVYNEAAVKYYGEFAKLNALPNID